MSHWCPHYRTEEGTLSSGCHALNPTRSSLIASCGRTCMEGNSPSGLDLISPWAALPKPKGWLPSVVSGMQYCVGSLCHDPSIAGPVITLLMVSVVHHLLWVELPSMQVLPQLAMKEGLVGFTTWQPEENISLRMTVMIYHNLSALLCPIMRTPITHQPSPKISASNLLPKTNLSTCLPVLEGHHFFLLCSGCCCCCWWCCCCCHCWTWKGSELRQGSLRSKELHAIQITMVLSSPCQSAMSMPMQFTSWLCR